MSMRWLVKHRPGYIPKVSIEMPPKDARGLLVFLRFSIDYLSPVTSKIGGDNIEAAQRCLVKLERSFTKYVADAARREQDESHRNDLGTGKRESEGSASGQPPGGD